MLPHPGGIRRLADIGRRVLGGMGEWLGELGLKLAQVLGAVPANAVRIAGPERSPVKITSHSYQIPVGTPTKGRSLLA